MGIPGAMSSDDNPYKSPAKVEDGGWKETPYVGWLATVLLVVWLLEGSVKLFFVAPPIIREGIDLLSLAELYRSTGLGWFAAGCTYFVFETIGPWFGVVYLIRCKRGKLTFEQALWKLLFAVGALSLIITAVLVLSMEIVLRTV